jgi:PST family polysaccharide transporter
MSSDDGKKSLTGSAIQGLIWGVGGKAGLILSNLLVLMVLSRLLTPAEFGLYAIAYLFIDFSFAIAHSGFGIAMVQQKELKPSELDACFTSFVLVGLAFCALLILSSGLIETSLDMPGLGRVLIAVAIAIPAKLAAGFYGLNLQREVKLKAYQNVQTLPTIMAGLAVTIPTALLGWGVWSLIIGYAVAVLIEYAMAYWLSGVRPRPTRALGQLRHMVRTGTATLTNRMIVFAGENFDKMAIAGLIGGASLGLYNRATSLVFLPTKLLGLPIESVFLSMFSRLQSERHRIAMLLERTIAFQTVLLIPAGIGLALASPLLIRIVLGGQWLEVIPVTQILFLVTFARLGYIPSEMAAISVGKAWGATGRQLAFTLAMLIGATVASRGGLVWIAAAVAFARLLFYVLSLRFVTREFGLSVNSLLVSHGQGVLIAMIAALPAMAITAYPPSNNFIVEQFATLTAYGSVLLLILLLGPGWLVGLAITEARSRMPGRRVVPN